MEILFIVRLILLFIIVYAIIKNLKTILKVAVVLFANLLLLGLWGI